MKAKVMSLTNSNIESTTTLYITKNISLALPSYIVSCKDERGPQIDTLVRTDNMEAFGAHFPLHCYYLEQSSKEDMSQSVSGVYIHCVLCSLIKKYINSV